MIYYKININNKDWELFLQEKSIIFKATVSVSYGVPAYDIAAQPNADFIMGISTYEYSSWSGGTSNLYVVSIS